MSANVVASAAALAPLIVGLRAETEAERRLPQQIVDALTAANLWRVPVPAELGGLELDPVTALRVYETLAQAEASVAWVVWNSSLPCWFGRFLGDEARREIFGNRANKFAVSTRPTGRGDAEPGGYRVSGRWSLVSGCMHADWIGLMYVVHDGGQPQMLAPGVPHMRVAFLPASACRIIDTWHVGGLRGTGSHDVVVEAVVVPSANTVSAADPSRIDDAIGRQPIIATMGAGHAAICLGIAQSATDAVLALANKKANVEGGPGMKDRATTQIAVAAAIAKLAALRSYLHAKLGEVWQLAESGARPTAADLADVWGAAVTTGRECRALVAEMYEVAGTTALYTDSVLERCHRDIHAAMQHVVAQRSWLEDTARVKFGMAPTNPLYAL
jgi:alkylation response protein AidB-like acyl-CoA dehydrogenase